MYYIGKWILLNQFLIAAVYYFLKNLKRDIKPYIYIYYYLTAGYVEYVLGY